MLGRILLACDGSEAAGRALALASHLAVKFGGTLHLVHVAAHRPPASAVQEFAKMERVEVPLAVELTAGGYEIVSAARAAAAAEGVTRVITEVLTGDPAERLLDYARDRKMDLVVLGRRGMGRVRGLLMGSVSLKVSSLAGCPVLTVS